MRSKIFVASAIVLFGLAAFAAGYSTGQENKGITRAYELRTYTLHVGKMADSVTFRYRTEEQVIVVRPLIAITRNLSRLFLASERGGAEAEHGWRRWIGFRQPGTLGAQALLAECGKGACQAVRSTECANVSDHDCAA